MIKLQIHNEVTGRSYGASFKTQEEANAWKESCIKKNSWGKEGDYVVTEEDLSLDKEFRNNQKIQARKKEYPSIEEVLHILLDHGVDSEQYASLQAERAAIKLKHILEK